MELIAKKRSRRRHARLALIPNRTGPMHGAMGVAHATAAKVAHLVNVLHSSHQVGTPATYYDVLEPPGGATRPTMVLLHGGSHTGFCYLATVDGRAGWAYDFVRHGHRVVVADWPGCGRSAYISNDDITAEAVCAGLAAVIEAQPEPVILMTHSMSGQLGWKLLEMIPDRIALVVGVAPGPPGNLQPDPIVLSETTTELRIKRTPTSTDTTIVLGRPFVPDMAFVAFKLIGPGTQFPRELAAQYLASLIPVPTPLLLRRLNYHGSALRIGDTQRIRGKRVVLVHGTDDPDHPREFEEMMAAWLNEHGAKCEHYALGDYGITGNGHMMMLERNSTDVADFIAGKI